MQSLRLRTQTLSSMANSLRLNSSAFDITVLGHIIPIAPLKFHLTWVLNCNIWNLWRYKIIYDFRYVYYIMSTMISQKHDIIVQNGILWHHIFVIVQWIWFQHYTTMLSFNAGPEITELWQNIWKLKSYMLYDIWYQRLQILYHSFELWYQSTIMRCSIYEIIKKKMIWYYKEIGSYSDSKLKMKMQAVTVHY